MPFPAGQVKGQGHTTS